MNPLKIIALTCAIGLWTLVAQAQTGLTQIQTTSGATVNVLYPTLAKAQLKQRGPFELSYADNAEPLIKPTHLIVMSSGTGGSIAADFDLATRLVQRGFVVAHPVHEGDHSQNTSKAGPLSWAQRPIEVTQSINAVLTDARFKPFVDSQKIGVHGMSAGGGTAIVMAGGQWSTWRMVQHCADNLAADIGFCLNGAGGKPDEQKSRTAQFERAKGVPAAYAPKELTALQGGLAKADPRPDPRVAAASVLVPAVAMFSSESLQAIKIPVAVVSAQADTVLLPTYHSNYLLKHCKTCLRLADIAGAGHFDALSPWPTLVAQGIAKTQMRGGEPSVDSSVKAAVSAAFDAIADFYVQRLKQGVLN